MYDGNISPGPKSEGFSSMIYNDVAKTMSGFGFEYMQSNNMPVDADR